MNTQDSQQKQDIILIDKPAGLSSFGVVARVRRCLSMEAGKKVKVGHTGTLDPFATGLLILLANKATKLSNQFLKLDKWYEAAICLGKTSTTGDPEGEIIEQNTEKVPTLEEVKAVVNQFVGQITQTVPAFSAVKINGQRAYQLARRGEAVVMPTRQIEIYAIEILSYNYPELVGILSDLVCNCVKNIFANINNYPALVTCINNAVNSRVDYIFNNIDRFPILKNLIETKVEARVTYIFEHINNFTELLNVIKGNIENIFDNIDNHPNLKVVIENKVESTVEHILSNIDNYPIIKEKIIQFCNEAIEAKRGVANGIASLDGDGKVPASQLPSYVDDVLEGYYVDETHFAEKYIEDAPVYYTPEKGKIYVDISEDTEHSGKTYRWSGTKYSVISETLALGEVTGTAYDGGKGKKTTDIVNSLHIKLLSSLNDVTYTDSKVNIEVTGINKNTNTNKYDDGRNYAKSINAATKTLAGVMSAADKVKLDETLPNQITELSNNVYTKEEINNKFDNVPTVENTYTKAEVDKAIADAIKALIPAGYELVIKKKTT